MIIDKGEKNCIKASTSISEGPRSRRGSLEFSSLFVRLVSIFFLSFQSVSQNSSLQSFIYFLCGFEKNIVMCATECLIVLKFFMQSMCYAISLSFDIFVILDCV
jgi:hypothetical protein